MHDVWVAVGDLPAWLQRQEGLSEAGILERLYDAIRSGAISHRIPGSRAPEGWLPDIAAWVRRYHSKPRPPRFMAFRAGVGVTVIDWDGADPNWDEGTVAALNGERCRIMVYWSGRCTHLNSASRWIYLNRHSKWFMELEAQKSTNSIGPPATITIKSVPGEPAPPKYQELRYWLVQRILSWPVGTKRASAANDLAEAKNRFGPKVSRDKLYRLIIAEELFRPWVQGRGRKGVWTAADAKKFADSVEREKSRELKLVAIN